MRIFQHIDQCNQLTNPVLTLGMFDGVHIGHQQIISQLNQIAKNVGGESVLLTFEPHPRIVLHKDDENLKFITPIEEKIDLLEKAGLQNLILHPFSKEFSQLTSTEFIVDCLVNTIGIHTIVIGYDHHFGKNREGNYQQLEALSHQYGFKVVQIQEIKSEDLAVSSTKVRNALWNGEIDYAHKALGRNYTLKGKVVHGDKIGRTLGFPTANLDINKYKLIPGNGVYIVTVNWENQTQFGLLSIGTRPTITNSMEKRVEVFLIDFEGDLYGKELELSFLHKIRLDQKFASIDDLVSQMNLDLAFAKNYLHI